MDGTFNNFAEPPGVYIEEELEARGWLQADLAYILNVSASIVNQLIRGKYKINAEMAKSLSKAFGTSAELFLNLQKEWDLQQAGEPDPGIAKRSLLQSEYPVREMIKRGWIKDSNPEVLEEQMLKFFERDSVEDIPHLAHAAKRIGVVENQPPAQIAWLYRVKKIAKEMVVPRYSEKKLKEAVVQMSNFRSEPELIKEVPRLMNECGVRLVFVEKLPGSKIDGVCTWLNKQSPVIGMTTLNDRIDNFWFVLRHEIAHVLHKHGQSAAIIDVETEKLTQNINTEERIANEEAAEFCIDQKKMNSFFQRKRPYFYEHDVIGFALLMNVHPGIIVGQIQKRTEDYRYLKKHQVGVRNIILPSAMYDGWGHIAPVDL